MAHNYQQHRDHPNEIVRKLVNHLEYLDRDKGDLKAEKDEQKRRADAERTAKVEAERAKLEVERQRDEALRGKSTAEQRCTDLDRTIRQQNEEKQRLQAKCTAQAQEMQQLRGQHAQETQQLCHAYQQMVQQIQGQHEQLQNQMQQREREHQQRVQEIQSDYQQKVHGIQDQYGQEKQVFQHKEGSMKKQIQELDKKLKICSHTSRWDIQPHSLSSQPSDVVINGSLVYFKESEHIHQCQLSLSSDSEPTWSILPQCPLPESSLGVIKQQLVAIGGVLNRQSTNQIRLYDAQKSEWVKRYPSLPTCRSRPIVVSTEQALIVAGGLKKLYSESTPTTSVEILSVDSNTWCQATSLPAPVCKDTHTATLCQQQLYVFPTACPGGGVCTTLELLDRSKRTHIHLDWRQVASTLTVMATYTFNGKLFALCADQSSHEKSIYLFDKSSNQWQIVDPFVDQYECCLATVIHDSTLMLVGVVGRLQIATKELKKVHTKTFSVN